MFKRIPTTSVLFLAAATLTALPLPLEAARGSVYDRANNTVKMGAVNEALGVTLLADASLWDDKPANAAQRLGWPQESRTGAQESYRLYAQFRKTGQANDSKATGDIAGAKAFSCALYGTPRGVGRISIVFANKGDCFAAAGSGMDHFKGSGAGDLQALNKLIEADAKSIQARLTSLLGDPRTIKYGTGSSQQKTLRWDWMGHAFMLSMPKGEYAALAIEPSWKADLEGKGGGMSDSELKSLIGKRVQRQKNGDVVLGDFPMVDQGPKGYCMPASFERVMRYMEIDADMYLIANMGDTTAGGGSSIEGMVKGMRSLLARRSRSLRVVEKRLDVNIVAQYIDQGVPIMWPHCRTNKFNALTEKRNEGRAGIESQAQMDAWKKMLATARSSATGLVPPAPENGHINTIIGYNKQTGEICFTDSWGENFTQRWMTPEEMAAVSMHDIEGSTANKLNNAAKKGITDRDLKTYMKTPVSLVVIGV